MDTVVSDQDFNSQLDDDTQSINLEAVKTGSVGSIDFSKTSNINDDIENGDLNKISSRSLSMTPDKDIEFVDGVNLINDCPYCYKPYGKLAANLSGPMTVLFLYVVTMIPFVIRWTLHSSYIHFTESEPTLRKSFETKYQFAIGFLASSALLIGEIFSGIQTVYESIRGYQATPPISYEVKDVDLHKGCAVIFRSPNGVPAWKTKNNKLAENRPTSFRKWVFSSTFLEIIVHIVYGWRWAFGSALFVGTAISVSALSFVPAKGVNGSGMYLFFIHLTNGFAVPMFIVFGIKLLYLFISTQTKNVRYEYTGRFENPIKMTRSGKIKSESPFFIFLTDKCPCNYAVDRDSKLPTQYKYSIRYHCMFTGGLKYACFALLTLYGIYIFGVSLYSMFTKPVLRTFMRR